MLICDEYLTPETLSDAFAAMAQHRGRHHVVAGCTDTLPWARDGRAGDVEIPVLIDVPKIPELNERRIDGTRVRLGAATPVQRFLDDAALGCAMPAMPRCAVWFADDQIRAQATIGGNIVNASPAADSVPALIAARATCVIAGASGRREVPVESIVTGPGRTSLGRDEFVIEFYLPKRPPRSADAYLRFIPRSEMDIAVVGAAVSVTLDAFGVCTDARIVLGAVAPTAVLVPEAAAALIGRTLDETALAELDRELARSLRVRCGGRGRLRAGGRGLRASAIAEDDDPEHERRGREDDRACERRAAARP